MQGSVPQVLGSESQSERPRPVCQAGRRQGAEERCARDRYIESLEQLVRDLVAAVKDERCFRGWMASFNLDVQTDLVLERAYDIGLNPSFSAETVSIEATEEVKRRMLKSR